MCDLSLKILKCSLTGLAFFQGPSATFSDEKTCQVGTTSDFFSFYQATEAIVLFRCFCNGCLILICTKRYKKLIAIYFESLPTKLVKLLFFFSISGPLLFNIYFVLHWILKP